MTTQLSKTLFSTSFISHQDAVDAQWAMLNTPGDATTDELDADGNPAQVMGLPVLVWGIPGGAKSSIHRKLGREWYETTKIHLLAQEQAEELGGYPIPNRDRTAVRKVPNEKFLELNAAGSALLIIDELGSVTEEKHAAAQSVLTERTMGSINLGAHVRILGIANPPECATNGEPLSVAFSNRFIHLPWVRQPRQGWKDYMMTAATPKAPVKRDLAALEARIRKEWPTVYAQAMGIVGAYVDRFESEDGVGGDLPQGYGVNPESGESDELRWASERTYSMLTRALAGAFLHGLNDAQIEYIVRGIFPEGGAVQFLAFYRDQDVPLPANVLANPDELELTARVDKTAVVLDMAVAYLAGLDPKDPSRMDAGRGFWRIVERVIESPYGGKELVCDACRAVAASPTHPKRPGLGLGSKAIPEAGAIMEQLYDVITVDLG